MLLVGPPKPDRSKDRGQTRFDPNPNCRLSMGPTTLSCLKKIVLLQKQQQIIFITRGMGFQSVPWTLV